MIYGERIRLRGIERADLPRFVQWLNDPEVMQGILITQPISQAWEDGWFERMITRPVEEQVMGIDLGLPGEEGAARQWRLVGSISFHNIDWRNRSAEFGIVIGDKTCWNQGLGTEAVRLLARHGFFTLNLNRIYLHVFDTNPRAIRAYEKAGFTHEGRQRQGEFKDGRYIDVLLMSMLRDEFVTAEP